MINPQNVTSHVSVTETHAQVVPVDHASRNVSLFAVPSDILLPENDIGNSDICEQLDDIDEAKKVIKDDGVTQLELEYPEVVEDSGSAEPNEEHSFT